MREKVPARQFLGDERPLVAYLLVHFVEDLLLLGRPLTADNGRVQVIVVPASRDIYL